MEHTPLLDSKPNSYSNDPLSYQTHQTIRDPRVIQRVILTDPKFDQMLQNDSELQTTIKEQISNGALYLVPRDDKSYSLIQYRVLHDRGRSWVEIDLQDSGAANGASGANAAANAQSSSPRTCCSSFFSWFKPDPSKLTIVVNAKPGVYRVK